MSVLLLALAIYVLVSLYGYRDAFEAQRDRIEQEIEEPLFAIWHIVGSLILFLAAGALIIGGILVAFGGSHMREAWLLSAITTGRVLLDFAAGMVSIILGLLLVRFTRHWLNETINGPPHQRPPELGGRHHPGTV